jgi:transglutaminase-like putative cysteine protease
MTTATVTGRRESFDWVLYVIVLVAIMCLPLGILSSGWVPDPDRLMLPALWASFLAVLLARSSLPTWLCWVIGVSFGVTNAVQYATRLLPRLSVIVRDLFAATGMLYRLISTGSAAETAPFAATVEHIAAHARASLEAVRFWVVAVNAGGTSEDVTVLWFLVVLAIWILTWNATFEMLRRQRPLAALLPLGVALVSNAAITHLALGHVQVFVGAMLLVIAYANMNRMHAIWERFGVDFSSELRRDSLAAGAGIATIAMVLALATPYTTYNRAVFLFWNRFGPTLESFYDELDRAFAGRNPVPEPPSSGSRDVALGVLPHDVGLGSDVSKRTVMYVTTSDAPPPPPEQLQEMSAAEAIDPRRFVERRYWRQRTYDIYNGSGWDTSERTTTEFRAEEPWTETLYPFTVLTQTFTLLEVRGNVVFGVNQPVTVESAYSVVARSGDDLVALGVDTDEYTVVSHVPQPTEDDLMAAEAPYDPVISARYLTLPDIPQRVRDLAQEIVDAAGAVTRYDKARAIESYLRAYTYDLNVAPPPLDQDIVEYFLFDVQRGYCDYSASAMVVMLRSVGVASRYASGFGMGTYDYAQERWSVSGENAHAWAEVYFPGLGWIEFEPTPTELPREFSGGAKTYDLPALPRPDAHAARSLVPLGRVGAGLLAVALAGLVVLLISGRVPYRPARSTETRQLVWRIYAALTNRAASLGVYPEAGQTPGEFLAALSRALEARGSYGGALAGDVGVISGAYTRARYGSATLSQEDRNGVVSAWNRLKPRLFGLLFRRSPHRR